MVHRLFITHQPTTHIHLVNLLCVQDSHRPTRYSRAQKWLVDHRRAQIRRSVSRYTRKTANRILNLCLTRFLNIRLDSITVLDEARHPHMVSTTQPSLPLCNLLIVMCDIRWRSRTASLEVRLYGMSLYPQSMSIRSFWRMQRGEVRDCGHSTTWSCSYYHFFTLSEAANQVKRWWYQGSLHLYIKGNEKKFVTTALSQPRSGRLYTFPTKVMVVIVTNADALEYTVWNWIWMSNTGM